MVIPIHGPHGPKPTEKGKAKSRAAAGGPSFAEALSSANASGQAVGAAAPMAPVTGAGLGTYVPLPDLTQEEVPADTQGQTAALLAHLRAMAQAALGQGDAMAARQQLSRLAGATATDEATLTDQQRTALNEARTRAAVEAAKTETKER